MTGPIERDRQFLPRCVWVLKNWFFSDHCSDFRIEKRKGVRVNAR